MMLTFKMRIIMTNSRKLTESDNALRQPPSGDCNAPRLPRKDYSKLPSIAEVSILGSKAEKKTDAANATSDEVATKKQRLR